MSWGETHKEGAEQREQVPAGRSVKPRWPFVVLRFQFGNLEAFAGLALGCLRATALAAPRNNGLLVEFL